MKSLPPDAPLLAIAKIVNAKLGPSAAVSFYRIQYADHSMETGIIYQCGVRRAVVTTRAMLGDGDADEIVRGVNEWIEQVLPQNKWTTDPSEAA
jgi:hypothetical protein